MTLVRQPSQRRLTAVIEVEGRLPRGVSGLGAIVVLLGRVVDCHALAPLLESRDRHALRKQRAEGGAVSKNSCAPTATTKRSIGWLGAAVGSDSSMVAITSFGRRRRRRRHLYRVVAVAPGPERGLRRLVPCAPPPPELKVSCHQLTPAHTKDTTAGVLIQGVGGSAPPAETIGPPLSPT